MWGRLKKDHSGKDEPSLRSKTGRDIKMIKEGAPIVFEIESFATGVISFYLKAKGGNLELFLNHIDFDDINLPAGCLKDYDIVFCTRNRAFFRIRSNKDLVLFCPACKSNLTELPPFPHEEELHSYVVYD